MDKQTITVGPPQPFLTLTQRSTLWESCQQKTPDEDGKHFLTEAEFKEFAEVVERRRLDPFTRQIYWTKRWVTKKGRYVVQIEATIVYLGPDGSWWIYCPICLKQDPL